MAGPAMIGAVAVEEVTDEALAARLALADQRAAQSEVQAVVHEGILNSVARMTPEQRQQLSQNARRLFK